MRIKMFEDFKKNEFTWEEIFSEVKEYYDVQITNGRETGPTNWVWAGGIDSNITEKDFYVIIKAKYEDSPVVSYTKLYPILGEAVDRLEEQLVYLEYIYFDGFFGNGRKFYGLPRLDEKDIYLASEKIQLKFSTKKPTGPTSRIGKFIDRFRDKTKTRSSGFTSNTGPM